MKPNFCLRILLACTLLTAATACTDDWDGYVGKPYTTTLEVQPELQLTGVVMGPRNYLVTCFCATNGKGETYTFGTTEIKGFTFEEGNAYTIRIHATPNKWDYVAGDGPAYEYELLKVISKRHVGIDESQAHEETLLLEDAVDNDGLYYKARNEATGEEFSLCRGEIIGFRPSNPDALWQYRVKVKVYPQAKPTNYVNNHTDKFRLVEVLSAARIGPMPGQ